MNLTFLLDSHPAGTYQTLEWDDEAEEEAKSGADGGLHDATAAQDSVTGPATVDTA